jgi:RNA:NAD 2'-phosphotransferase (TPT1/KptA family)
VNRQNACVETVTSIEAQARLKHLPRRRRSAVRSSQLLHRDRNSRDRAIKLLDKQNFSVSETRTAVLRHHAVAYSMFMALHSFALSKSALPISKSALPKRLSSNSISKAHVESD